MNPRLHPGTTAPSIAEFRERSIKGNTHAACVCKRRHRKRRNAGFPHPHTIILSHERAPDVATGQRWAWTQWVLEQAEVPSPEASRQTHRQALWDPQTLNISPSPELAVEGLAFMHHIFFQTTLCNSLCEGEIKVIFWGQWDKTHNSSWTIGPTEIIYAYFLFTQRKIWFCI